MAFFNAVLPASSFSIRPHPASSPRVTEEHSHCRAASPRILKRSRAGKGLLHPGPADARGLFGRGGAMPVCLQADCIAIAGLFEGFELSRPIDIAFVDRSPHNFSSVVLDRVFAVAVMNAVLGKRVPGGGECIEFTAH